MVDTINLAHYLQLSSAFYKLFKYNYVTLYEGSILFILYNSDVLGHGITSNGFVKHCSMNRATVARNLNSLVDKGHVVLDKRLYRLTEKGMMTCRKVLKDFNDYKGDGFSKFESIHDTIEYRKIRKERKLRNATQNANYLDQILNKALDDGIISEKPAINLDVIKEKIANRK